MDNLTNKVIVVTGAGSGIGRALALQLADQGAFLALNDWNNETLQETVALVQERGAELLALAFDVSDRTAWEAFAQAIRTKFTVIDGLINNAGLTLFPETIPETDPIDFAKVINVNLWGVIHGSQIITPFLLQREDAFIANVSSLLGLMGYASQGPYVTSKFAVRGFTETLRQELKGTGTQVISVHPGPIRTAFTRNIKHDNPEALNRLATAFEKEANTTAEQAAAAIIKGIQRNKSRILIGKRTTILDAIVRFLPSSYHKYIPSNFRPGRLIKQALVERKERKAAMAERT